MPTARLASGVEVPVPFECRDADALIVSGTARLESIRRWMEGTGLQPVPTGDDRGAVLIWVMDYRDTVVGPYQEIVAMAPGRESDGPPLSGPWAGFAAALDPSVRGLVHRLLLPEAAKTAIDYGREILHLDKEAVSRIEVGRDPFVPVRTADAWAGPRLAMRLRIGEDDSWRTHLRGAWAVAKQAGWSRALGALGSMSFRGAAPARMGGGHIEATFRGRLRLQPWNRGDELQLTDATALGADVKEALFVPHAVQRIARCWFRVDLA